MLGRVVVTWPGCNLDETLNFLGHDVSTTKRYLLFSFEINESLSKNRGAATRFKVRKKNLLSRIFT